MCARSACGLLIQGASPNGLALLADDAAHAEHEAGALLDAPRLRVALRLLVLLHHGRRLRAEVTVDRDRPARGPQGPLQDDHRVPVVSLDQLAVRELAPEEQ